MSLNISPFRAQLFYEFKYFSFQSTIILQIEIFLLSEHNYFMNLNISPFRAQLFYKFKYFFFQSTIILQI
jgi:hypothetical protein